jgi:hypothetical protein
MKGWNGTLPVPWHSPAFPPRAVDAGAPKALVVEPPKGVVVLPNGFDVAVVPVPKAGLLAPNKPPLGFDEPKADVVEGAVEPNPPKLVEPDVAVPLPNRLPPLVAVVLPKPPGFAPKALVCGVPKPGF